ncbi:MAG: hypothetical protein WC905_00690 [Patescibacteria group bacterium]|jgi:hypothetical protein
MSINEGTVELMESLEKAEQDNKEFIADIDRQINQADLSYAKTLVAAALNKKEAANTLKRKP